MLATYGGTTRNVARKVPVCGFRTRRSGNLPNSEGLGGNRFSYSADRIEGLAGRRRKSRRWQTKGARAYHVSRYGLYTCDRQRARPGRWSGGNARHPVEAVDSASYLGRPPRHPGCLDQRHNHAIRAAGEPRGQAVSHVPQKPPNWSSGRWSGARRQRPRRGRRRRPTLAPTTTSGWTRGRRSCRAVRRRW